VPHVVLATGLFAILLPIGLLGSESMLVLANAALALPLAASLIQSSFAAIDPILWITASSLGARPWAVFRGVLMPMLMVSIVMSLMLVFHSAWDESIVALFIGPLRVPMLSTRIYGYVSQSVNPAVAAVATVVTAVTFLLATGLSGFRWLSRRWRKSGSEKAIGR
jgi:ABC-type spermidine/putrescine transport system permease subunit II